MTNFSKCDVCRTRKVRCDEKKPTCTPCRRGKRPCTYTFASKDVFVRRRVSLRQFHTSRVLRSNRTPSAEHKPDPNPTLVEQLSPKSRPEAPENATQDAATQAQRPLPIPETNETIPTFNSAQPAHPDVPSYWLARLLHPAEIDQGHSHTSVLHRWLDERKTAGQWGELEELSDGIVWLEDVRNCLCLQTTNIPERNITVRTSTLPPVDRLEAAREHIMHTCTRVPHLIHLLRRVRAHPDNPGLKSEVITLASTIYDSDAQNLLEALAHEGVQATEPTHWPLATTLRMMRHFDSALNYVFFIIYYTYRAIICGLLLRIAEISPPLDLPFDSDILAAEAAAAATHICMCVEYGTRGHGVDSLFRTLLLYDPLAVAWGIFDQINQRQLARGNGPAAMVEWSVTMKTYCREGAAHIMRQSRPGPALLHNFDAAARDLTGASILTQGLGRSTDEHSSQLIALRKHLSEPHLDDHMRAQVAALARISRDRPHRAASAPQIRTDRKRKRKA